MWISHKCVNILIPNFCKVEWIPIALPAKVAGNDNEKSRFTRVAEIKTLLVYCQNNALSSA